MVWENFQIFAVQITGNAFASKKINSRHFYSSPPGKIVIQVLIITSETEESYSFPPQTAFFFKNIFHQGKKGRVTIPAVIQFGIYDLNDG